MTSTSNCTQIAPFDFAGEPRAQITPRTQSLDHAFNFAEIAPQDHTEIAPIAPITPQDHTETAPIALRSHPRITQDRTDLSFPIWCRHPPLILIYLSLSLPSSLNLTGFDEFFLVGFCFYVYLLRNGIIYLLGSWENVRHKKKMCFLYYFQQHNQTLENIFQSIF